jgi:hypothetical protein
MGARIQKYYDYIEDKVGYAGRVKLAISTKVPSSLAFATPDSNEILEKFKKAIFDITGLPVKRHLNFNRTGRVPGVNEV